METTPSFDLHDKFGPDITLVRLEVRERTISFLRRFYRDKDMKGPKKPGKHDFIIITALDSNRKPFSLVAEKLRKWTICGGMPSHIHLVPLSEYSSAASPFRSRFVRELHNQIVSTAELKRSLETSGHHYNLFSDNCWRYATRTVETVLILCLHYSRRIGDLKAERDCLEALQQLETVKRPLPLDLLRLIYNPLSRKNPDTWRKIWNWWSRRSVHRFPRARPWWSRRSVYRVSRARPWWSRRSGYRFPRARPWWSRRSGYRFSRARP